MGHVGKAEVVRHFIKWMTIRLIAILFANDEGKHRDETYMSKNFHNTFKMGFFYDVKLLYGHIVRMMVRTSLSMTVAALNHKELRGTAITLVTLRHKL